MDLVSFLQPGRVYPAALTAVLQGDQTARPVLVRLLAGRRGPLWFSPAPPPEGRNAVIEVTLFGYGLSAEGDLVVQPGGRASIRLRLLAELRGHRYLSPRLGYYLRLRLLGRIDEDQSMRP